MLWHNRQYIIILWQLSQYVANSIDIFLTAHGQDVRLDNLHETADGEDKQKAGTCPRSSLYVWVTGECASMWACTCIGLACFGVHILILWFAEDTTPATTIVVVEAAELTKPEKITFSQVKRRPQTHACTSTRTRTHARIYSLISTDMYTYLIY